MGATLDPVFLAQHKFQQHKYEDCIALCTELLAANPYDQAVWYLKCRSLTLMHCARASCLDLRSTAPPRAPVRAAR